MQSAELWTVGLMSHEDPDPPLNSFKPLARGGARTPQPPGARPRRSCISGALGRSRTFPGLKFPGAKGLSWFSRRRLRRMRCQREMCAPGRHRRRCRLNKAEGWEEVQCP